MTAERTHFMEDTLLRGWLSVPYVSRPDAPIQTRASFIVEDGRLGALQN
jgi:alkaline phosphatase D